MDIELSLTTETVQQASPAEPVCVEPQATVREVLGLLKKHHDGGVLICRDGVLAGIFTERDALGVMARGSDLDAPIISVMVPSPVTVSPDATVASAIQKMSSGGYRRLPIVAEGGRPVGVVHVSGIVHYLVEHFPKTVYNQPPVAHPVMQEREGS